MLDDRFACVICSQSGAFVVVDNSILSIFVRRGGDSYYDILRWHSERVGVNIALVGVRYKPAYQFFGRRAVHHNGAISANAFKGIARLKGEGALHVIAPNNASVGWQGIDAVDVGGVIVKGVIFSCVVNLQA